jgi:hypothetical protein
MLAHVGACWRMLARELLETRGQVLVQWSEAKYGITTPEGLRKWVLPTMGLEKHVL